MPTQRRIKKKWIELMNINRDRRGNLLRIKLPKNNGLEKYIG
jgi:hypothetical protein